MLGLMDWSIPPIRWGGSVSSNINKFSGDTNQSTGNATVLSLRGASYIFQPWFAQVSGNIDFLSATSSSSSIGADNDTGSKSTAINFGGNLSLFPLSRFPVQAYVEKSDSRANANLTGTQFTSTRLGVSQNWRPEIGADTASAAFDHSGVATKESSSTVDALRGSYSTIIDAHSMNGTASYSTSNGDSGGQASALFNVSGAHTWSEPDEGLMVSTFANVSDNQIRMSNGSVLSNLGNRLLQLGSNVSWQPDEDVPLTINGGANMFSSNTVSDADTTSFFNLNGFANTQYRFSNNLSAVGGLILLYSRTTGQSLAAVGLNSSLSYSGDPVLFGKTMYNWGTSVGLNNLNASSGSRSTALSSSAQHAISHSMVLGGGSMLSLNATQALSISKSNNGGEDAYNTSGTSLSHSVGVSWFSKGEGGKSSSVSSTFSDSLSVGGVPSHNRNLFVQGNLQMELSRRSSFSGSLNVNASQQLSDQTNEVTPVFGFGNTTARARNSDPVWGGGGGVSYNHRNPFDIANLVYSATLQNNFNQANLRLVSGDPNALVWQTGMVFQQTVSYRLGRLNFRGSNTVTSNNGIRNVSIYGTVIRNFGEY